MKTDNRALIGILFFATIIGVFFGGFMYGKVYFQEPIVNESSFDTEAISEVYDILNANHYQKPTTDILIDGAIKGMISALDDPYTYYFSYDESNGNNEESYIGIGIAVGFINNKIIITNVFENSPAETANLHIGDSIVSINDNNVLDMTLEEFQRLFSGDIGDTKEIVIQRGTIEITITVTLATIDTPTVVYYDIEDIAYIKINSFTGNAATLFTDYLAEIDNKFASSTIKGLVIDVRNNPGGSDVILRQMLRLLLTTKEEGSNVYFSLETNNNTEVSVRSFEPLANNVLKLYPIKVLINEQSCSASEAFVQAMSGFQGYDSFGKTTYGKGVFQVQYEIESLDNYFLNVTSGYWNMYNGENVHDLGGYDPTFEVDIPDFFSSYYPMYNEEIAIDNVNEDVANIQVILSGLGYTGRIDGYFDVELENFIIDSNYNLLGIIDQEAIDLICIDYLDLLDDIENDLQLQAAITSINEE